MKEIIVPAAPGFYALFLSHEDLKIPRQLRIKLETVQDVQSEMGKCYRAVQHGELAPSDGTRFIFILDKLRASGLPDARANAAGGGGFILNICPIAAGTYFSREACQHLQQTGQLPPDAVITLIEPTEPETQPLLSAPDGAHAVVPFPASRFSGDGDDAA